MIFSLKHENHFRSKDWKFINLEEFFFLFACLKNLLIGNQGIHLGIWILKKKSFAMFIVFGNSQIMIAQN